MYLYGIQFGFQPFPCNQSIDYSSGNFEMTHLHIQMHICRTIGGNWNVLSNRILVINNLTLNTRERVDENSEQSAVSQKIGRKFHFTGFTKPESLSFPRSHQLKSQKVVPYFVCMHKHLKAFHLEFNFQLNLTISMETLCGEKSMSRSQSDVYWIT